MTTMNPYCLKLLRAIFLLFLLQVELPALAASWKTTDANISCIEKERQALLELKQLLVDDSGRLSSWGNDIDCCKWNGIQCNNQTGHVEQLNLRSRGVQPLRGEISASLINLPQLNYLDLSWNDFGGKEIPEFIGSLTNLRYLNLSDASFGGKIPYQLGKLSSLKELDLYGNNLVGVIPHQLGNLSRLEILYLGGNDYLIIDADWFSHLSSLKKLGLYGVSFLNKSKYWLQMVRQLPKLDSLSLQKCNLSNIDLILLSPSQLNFSKTLTYLDLSRNKFSSSIFTWLLNLSSNLTYLDLSLNLLEGPIPDDFFNGMKCLQFLYLQGNCLSGTIPKSIGLLSELKSLNVGNNSLSGASFGGKIPDQLGKLSSLKHLDLSHNKFSSSIFTWLLNLSSNLTYLDLSENLLEGPIPDDFFNGMKCLQFLYLPGNRLSGTIPKSIGLLSELKSLDVGNNYLEGVITDIHFENLTNLKVLFLSSNSLTLKFSNNWIPPFQLEVLGGASCKVGPAFPKWLLTQNKLRVLHLSNSSISDKEADISFLCAEWSARLFALDMSHNQLSGGLPNCWSHLESLKILDLSNNEFSGNIPSSMGSLVQIRHLILRNNQFTGELPSLSTCSDLKVLDVGDNKLSGPIPSWIGSRLQRLEVLDLGKNLFDGILPLTLCQLTTIRVLDLSQNKLPGVIPKCIKNFSAMSEKNYSGPYWNTYYFTRDILDAGITFSFNNYLMLKWKGRVLQFTDNWRLLKLIDLSSNQMSGNIPKEIGNLMDLVSLNLSRNNFSGEISSELGQLQSLDSADLSRNHFSGRIPSSLSNISMLSFLDLSYNNLSGKIPIGTQLQSFNATQYEGNDYLCGKPLERPCPEDKEFRDPSVSTKHEKDHEDSLFIQGFYLSMGLGFFTGFSGIFGSLLLFRSWRHAYFHFVNNLMEWICVMSMIYLARCRRWLNI